MDSIVGGPFRQADPPTTTSMETSFFNKARRLPLPWSAALAVALVDIAWVLTSGWSLQGSARMTLMALGAGVLLPLLLCARYRSDLRVRSTVLAVLLLISFSFAASILSYLVVGAGMPLVDEDFSRWDRAIGFDWLASTYWVAERPALKLAFAAAYHSGMLQIGFVVLFLGFTARISQLDEFIGLYISGLLLAIAVSLIFPAAGPWVNAPTPMPFDASVLSHFSPLHNGSLRTVDFDHAQGLISMPSVHAMLAIFLSYAMRGTGGLTLFFAALNILMLASTPTEGGHYLVDVIAGALCAGAMIAIYRRHKFAKYRQPDSGRAVAVFD